MPMMGPADDVEDLGDDEAVAAARLAVGVEVTTAVAVIGTMEVLDCRDQNLIMKKARSECQQCNGKAQGVKRREVSATGV